MNHKTNLMSDLRFFITCHVWEQSLMDYNLQTNFIFSSRDDKKEFNKKAQIYTHSTFLLHFIMEFDLFYRGIRI